MHHKDKESSTKERKKAALKKACIDNIKRRKEYQREKSTIEKTQK